jgi:NTP pyrophosphatase (non-canonical NTP hydrolase)
MMEIEMNPWHPITSAIDLKHLGKLGEELGEASAAVSRCIIQGLDEAEPETGKINRAWLEDELADVFANMMLVIDHFGLNNHRIIVRSEEKKRRLREWHRMA